VYKKCAYPYKTSMMVKKIRPNGLSFSKVLNRDDREALFTFENDPAITKAPPASASSFNPSAHDPRWLLYGSIISSYGTSPKQYIKNSSTPKRSDSNLASTSKTIAIHAAVTTIVKR